MKHLKIRQEVAKDHETVFTVIKRAFENVEYSDQSEPFLVEKLRKSDAFIPELSLVAEIDKEIVGFIILTKIHIKKGEQLFDALALAPVAVLPKYHGQGIGGQLIKEAHHSAKILGHQRIILLGHADYYPRFGYELTSKYGVRLPFEAPVENCMVIGLGENALEGVSGVVVYSEPFMQ